LFMYNMNFSDHSTFLKVPKLPTFLNVYGHK
jgi:hypothetical protein